MGSIPRLRGLVAVGTLALAVWARNEPAPAPLPAAPVRADAPLLLDLADDADASLLARVAAAVRGAVAPAPWPSGAAALGRVLSREAQLYRLDPVPARELEDVRRALAALGDAVEGVEAEGTWTIPCLASPGTCGDAAPLGEAPAPAPTRGDGRFVPDDPYYPHQWHLAQIGMPEAWAASRRGRGVVVAVLDTGVAARPAKGRGGAPDLAGTALVAGRDLVDGDDDPTDPHGHGTHVAGTIAQTTNNGVGVAGVAPEVALMPVRVLDARGAGGWGTVAAGIRWAADHGADVINLSLGGRIPSATVRRAVEHAHRRGVVVVAAAGNAGAPRLGYPAGYAQAISVGAVRFDETLAFYSNHGRSLDLVAPGGDLRVDQNDDGIPDGVIQNMPVGAGRAGFDYVPLMGTSMAAPHVAGVAALLVSAGVDDPDAVASALRRGARPTGEPARYGAGLLSAPGALAAGARATAATRAGLVAWLLPLCLVGFRRRVGLLPVAGWAFLAAGVAGLALPPGVPSGLVDLLLAALPAGTSWPALVVLGPAVPIALAALLGGHRRAAAPLAGVALAFAAAALAEAVWPQRHLGALDPVAGLLLWGGALVSAGLAALLARGLPGEPRRGGPPA